MKMEIMILNTMRYRKEGEQTYKSRLAYIIPTKDAFSDNDNFKGYSELSLYKNDASFFEKIPVEFIGQKCEITIEEKPSKNNPMKSYKDIIEVSCNEKTISLV